ncbi:MAG: response regulator [Deltaproteobacteria bacterium]|nr:response regulator [Kofleriaceae bacterium]
MAGPGATLRVLIVDDDEEFRLSLIDALRATTYVAAVATPAEAVWALSQETYDVLICDLQLATDTTGDDVLEAARTEWPRMVRILVTGQSAHVHDAPHPAHAVLFKPLDLGALRDLLSWLPAVASTEVQNDNGHA